MPSPQRVELYLLRLHQPRNLENNSVRRNSLEKAIKMMMQVVETSRRLPAKAQRRKGRSKLASFLLGAAIVVGSGFAIGVVAQEAQPQKPVVTKRTYGSGRDPFRKYEPPPPVAKRMVGQSPIPTIQERIGQYKAQKV